MLKQKRVLVVEDETLLAIWIEDILIEAGAVVVGPATTIASALSLLETARLDGGLDAAVLDYNLAGVLVLPVAAALARRGVPFIIQSAYHDVPELDGIPRLRKP